MITQWMDQTSEYTQLWIEERQILAERAALVPDNGTIVEIGTAQGGSALFLHATAADRGVKIYSFDIAPSAEAYENLKHTSVAIVATPSMEGAYAWHATVQRPIDLLFIDGSHALQHVFEDFNAWCPLLRPGGEIVFHDYDSIERGGLVHLGVRIVLDTVLRSGFVERPVHQCRMLYGTINRPSEMRLHAKDCYQTFAGLARKIVRVRDVDYGGWTLVGDKRFAELLRGCFRVDGTAEPISPEAVRAAAGRYVVFARPLAEALNLIQVRGVGADAVVALDTLQACYFLAHALTHNRDRLLTLTSSRKEFFRWEEMLFMFEHAFGPSLFPDQIGELAVDSTIARLSQVVAHEQIRLVILAQLLKTFVDWTP